MTDIFTPEKRSWVMSQISGKDTKIEKKMRKILTNSRIKFVQHPQMFGNPDFILEKQKIAIFCDGDFWHGYNYRKKIPEQKFWRKKIERNMVRDKKVSRKLRSEGWSVLRFWEHDIEKKTDACINKLIKKIKEK